MAGGEEQPPIYGVSGGDVAPPSATSLAKPDQPSGAGVPALVATNLSKRYIAAQGRHVGVTGVSLQVMPGESVAIMGPSGCGKSTLLHMLAGLLPPDSGSVSISGQHLTQLSERRRAAFRRDHVGTVFQFFNLIPSLTAAENVALPLRLHNEECAHRDRISRKAIRERVSSLLDALQLTGLQGRSPEQIAGGEQQRVAIARALAHRPGLLLADEPTGNLDWSTAHEVMALIHGLVRSDPARPALVATHHDAAMAAYADRVVVMQEGRVIDEVRMPARVAGGVPDVGPLVSALAGRGL